MHSLEQELSSSLLVSTFDTKEDLARIWVFMRLLQKNQRGLGSFVSLCVPRNKTPPPSDYFLDTGRKVGHRFGTTQVLVLQVLMTKSSFLQQAQCHAAHFGPPATSLSHLVPSPSRI